ncbi:MAG: hypothetical protein M1820_008344 [Bogoriella megaspora]|nr:MAG: hypothetical protein M1820_008344 [Bogoriella megaspora]
MPEHLSDLPTAAQSAPQTEMSQPNYPIPNGLYAIPPTELDLRTPSEIDEALLHPPSISSEKNIFFFWATGLRTLYPYTKRNVHAYFRRLHPHNWSIYVLDLVDGSPLHVSNFLSLDDENVVPKAFRDGELDGEYKMQHYSDLVRWPLLLKYGGCYIDVGMLGIGDLNRLWEETIGNAGSPYEAVSYSDAGSQSPNLANYFLASGKGNPLFERCHRLLLELWKGKTNTEGMHRSALLKGTPLMQSTIAMEDGETEEENQKRARELSESLTDYIIQGQVMTMVMGLVDEEDGWDGPRYVAEHVYGIDFMVGSQLVNEYTSWDGQKAWDLLSLEIPKEGEVESDVQKQAREIVEGCLQRSFGFKLAHGLILKVTKVTLGSLWRKHEGSDDVPGTYAHWLRYAMASWNQEQLPPPGKLNWPPIKKGSLLKES